MPFDFMLIQCYAVAESHGTDTTWEEHILGMFLYEMLLASPGNVQLYKT